MADNEESEIAALKARLAALESTPNTPAAPKKKGLGCGGMVAVALLIGAVSVMLLAQLGSSLPSDGVTNASWTPPPGYTVQDADYGKTIGVKWDTPDRSECRSGNSCFAIDVVPAQNCDRSLYVSITLLDATGNNIGWTNDTAQGVQAGETARLVFTTYEENVDSARIAEASCY